MSVFGNYSLWSIDRGNVRLSLRMCLKLVRFTLTSRCGVV